MSESEKSPLDVFKQRVDEIVPSERIETFDGHPGKLYLFAAEGGLGITADCYDGLDARLIESIGMASLNEDHRLYRDNAHHVLIFKVE